MRCECCGQSLAIGDYPFCPHGRPARSSAPNFKPYFDIGLGSQVDAPDQRRKLMRANSLDYRDHMKRGDLSARRDRIEQQKREARHGG